MKSGLLRVLMDEMAKVIYAFKDRTQGTGGSCFRDSSH